MIADLLEELAPQLGRRVEARIAAAGESELAPGRCKKQLSVTLLHELVRVVRAGRIDGPPCRKQLSIGADIQPILRMSRILKECVYDAIEEHRSATSPKEMRLVGDWFAALTEMVLREENRRFSVMLDALPDHVALNDAEGRLVYLNRSAAEEVFAVAGVARQDLIGRRLPELGLPAVLLEQVTALLPRLQSGEPVTDEVRFPGPNGGRWREQHFRPVFDADGKVEAFAMASRDIHDRKVAESRLQLLSKVGTLAEATEYEGVLSGLSRLVIPELADWCIVDVVEDGQVRRGTVAHGDPDKAAIAEEILQFAPELYDLPIGRNVLAGQAFLMGEVDDAAMREHKKGKFFDVVRRLGARSVMIVPFVVLGTPVAVATFVFTPESGRRHGPEDLALAQEMARRAAQIIENARLHQQLRQSEARFRVALEHSNIAVFEEDTDFRIRWMYNAQFGADGVAAVDRTAHDYLPFEASAELDAVKRRVLETGEGARTAVDAIVGGQRRHLLVNFEPLRAVGGIVGITGAAVDITEAKQAQEELSQALAFRERMMGILGHDLRNPLSAVLGLSGLLRQQDGLSDNAREGLKRIGQAAERMNEMIGTLLDFTQLRFRGGMALSLEQVELDALARAVVDELRAAHPRREILVDGDGELRGRWDAGHLARVVSNLVGNALTHGATGSPVRISLSSDDKSAVLAVTNRGPAIPKELADRLFEPFWQGPNQTDAPHAHGLGLGLFIARQIVQAHGGTIDVHSSDDMTTFTVRLPRVATAA